jgi:hypothetical protein
MMYIIENCIIFEEDGSPESKIRNIEIYFEVKIAILKAIFI